MIARFLRAVPSWLVHPGIRLAFAMLLVVFHLALIRAWTAEFQGVGFDHARGSQPAFDPPDMPHSGFDSPPHWNRLAVARWDAAHYEALALRGYTLCPEGKLNSVALTPIQTKCFFNFYPGYPLLGRCVRWITGWGIDYSLFAISIAAALGLFFLLTGAAFRERLGIHGAYLNAILMASFTTSFAFVTVQTEALTAFLSVLGFVLVRKRWWLAGAVVAGLASSLRVTGSATGAALIAALAFDAIERGERFRRWVPKAVLLAPISVWGQLAILAYYARRFGDALLYTRAHRETYHHEASIVAALWPARTDLLRSMFQGLHEALFILLALLALGLGLRRAMRSFPTPERAYWWVVLLVTVGIALVGSSELQFQGMNRYWLVAIPLFFALTALLRRRPVALVLWLAFNAWHYWNVDLCFFLSEHNAGTPCSVAGDW
jgi:hypothetical protein